MAVPFKSAITVPSTTSGVVKTNTIEANKEFSLNVIDNEQQNKNQNIISISRNPDTADHFSTRFKSNDFLVETTGGNAERICLRTGYYPDSKYSSLTLKGDGSAILYGTTSLAITSPATIEITSPVTTINTHNIKLYDDISFSGKIINQKAIDLYNKYTLLELIVNYYVGTINAYCSYIPVVLFNPTASYNYMVGAGIGPTKTINNFIHATLSGTNNGSNSTFTFTPVSTENVTDISIQSIRGILK